MRQLLLAATLLTGIPLASANAILQFSLDINGATFNCVDNSACDTNGTTGIIQTGPTVFNGVDFLGSSQTQLTGGINELTTTSFQITNNNAAAITYQLAVGGTGFVGPVSNITESGSGTFTNAIGSNIQMQFAADAANTQGADTPTDLPGTLLSTSPVITATSLSSSIAFNDATAFSAPGLYSMTEAASGTLTAGGQLTGRSQSEIAINTPEPASLLLLGMGLLGLGMVRYRRQ